MLGSRSRTTNLRAKLEKALSAQRVNQALDLYELIEERNPHEPRWPHRKGDLLQRMGRKADAVLAYERCVGLYAAKGFVARAAAMAKVILSIDPTKDAVFERVNPKAAQGLHRQNQSVAMPADELLNTERETPPTETTEDATLHFTQVELARRPPPPEPLVSERPCAGTLAQLPSMLLFADVPAEILDALVRKSTLIDAADGQRFVTEGTAADALYVLIQGNAVEQRGADSQSLLLGEGDVAGVSSLLSNVSFGGDVIACGPALVLQIGKPLLDQLVQQHPAFEDVLQEILCRRLVTTLLRTSPIFTVFDESTRTQIARLFEVRRVLAGTRLVEAGAVSDGVYLPLHGRILARKPDGTFIGFMELGQALGQESILTRRPLPFSVEAESDALVLCMPAHAFSDLLLRRPDVVQHMGRQVSSTRGNYRRRSSSVRGHFPPS